MRKFFITISIVIAGIIICAIVWELIYVKSISVKQVYIFPKGFRGVLNWKERASNTDMTKGTTVKSYDDPAKMFNEEGGDSFFTLLYV